MHIRQVKTQQVKRNLMATTSRGQEAKEPAESDHKHDEKRAVRKPRTH